MFNITKREIDWAGRKLTLESGRIARQSNGAVLATLGDTAVLCAVVADRNPRPGVDFFPLTVHYQEKTYAAGKIPGGFFKREGRPSEKETLTSRLIDRPIRPLFADGFRNETQVICTVMSHDLENDPDIVAMVATSAALTISGIPFPGPIGCARVGYSRRRRSRSIRTLIDRMDESDLDLVVAGTRDGVLMVESEAQGTAGGRYARRRHASAMTASSRCSTRSSPWPRSAPSRALGAAGAAGGDRPGESRLRKRRHCRRPARRLRQSRQAGAPGKPSPRPRTKAMGLFDSEDGDGRQAACRRRRLQEDREGHRPRRHPQDRRAHRRPRHQDDVRPIVSEVGVLARAHGSALFTRGETQALVTAHARHRPGRADRRRAGRRVPAALPAALQLPALLGRRGRPLRPSGPARDRPWQARLARAASGDAEPRRSFLTPSAWSRRSPNRTARPRWRRSAAARSR